MKSVRLVSLIGVALVTIGLLVGVRLLLSHEGAPVAVSSSVPPVLTRPAELKVVAIVNSVALYPEQIAQNYLMDSALSSLVGAAAPRPEECLTRAIHMQLVLQAAAQSGYVFPEAEITPTLRSFLASHGSSREALDSTLNAYGVTSVSFLPYYRQLLTVDTFSRQAAAADGIVVADYVGTLLAAAEVQTFEANLPDLTVPVSAQALPVPTATPLPLPTPTQIPASPTVSANQAVRRDIAVGALAPDFSLETLDGASVTWDSLVGRPVVLSFWVTWCSHCRAQTPVFIAAYHNYEEAGVAFIGVNVKESAETAQAYASAQGIPYKIALDSDGVVAASYHVAGLPTTYILDSEGRVAQRHVGELSRADLDLYLGDLLND